MKNKYIKFKWVLPCLLTLGSVVSCNTFESEPLDRLTDDYVWKTADSTATYAERYLNGVYNALPLLHNRLGYDYLDAGTDDAMSSIARTANNNVNSFRNGTISTRNVVDNNWFLNYMGIRQANIFLANVDGVAVASAKAYIKPIWKAEARFLRALYYFELIKRWGGVPLIGDKVYTIDEKIELSRNTLEECTNYILSELDAIESTAYKSKGLTDGNIGRVTDGAINALRSRLLLYMASPLYNTTNDVTKWENAAKAAKKVIDMNAFSLSTLGFKALFYTLKNTETIFVNESSPNTTIEQYNSPVGYQSTSFRCKGFTSPSQGLVDAFLTLSGKRITDDGSEYDPNNPYVNRDPRLGMTVLYNGASWMGRPVETFEGGLDKPNRNLPQTQTGYYLRKFLGSFETATFSNTQHSYIMFRYAEILLNYAEALNESNGSKTEIEKAIIDIRKRAGISPGADTRYGLPTTYTQLEMREIIRNERRIEMAFEEQRFWDIRRWKIAEDVMNKPVQGMKITKSESGTYSYQVINVENSTFDAPRMYQYPIPYAEMLGNKNLVQNPGWNY